MQEIKKKKKKQLRNTLPKRWYFKLSCLNKIRVSQKINRQRPKENKTHITSGQSKAVYVRFQDEIFKVEERQGFLTTSEEFDH